MRSRSLPFVWGGLALATAVAACGTRRPPPRVPTTGADLVIAPREPAPRRACRGAEIPPDRHYVAPGLCARAVATDQGALRGIAFTGNGDLFGVTADGIVRRYRDVNGNGHFENAEIVDFARTGESHGHDCDPDETHLYCGTPDGVTRFHLETGGIGQDVILGQPRTGARPIHPVRVHGGFLYVASGPESDAEWTALRDYDPFRAVVRRFRLSDYDPRRPFAWTDGEVFVRGIRYASGIARGPGDALFAVVEGTTNAGYRGVDVHQENPGDAVVRLEHGRAYGYPFCFYAAQLSRSGEAIAPGTPLAADVVNGFGAVYPGRQTDRWCAENADRIATFLPARSSALDLEFHLAPSKALPARWRGGAFAALHGSSGREPETGYRVVWIPFDAEGRSTMPRMDGEKLVYPFEIVFGGGSHGVHRDGPWGWRTERLVTPASLAISPVDGALYVSSDNLVPGEARANGVIYRIEIAR